MIYGTGIDITYVPRFKKWVSNPEMLERFFNPLEMSKGKSEQALLEHYAVRFAAKEAFGKALGTGLAGFELNEVWISKDENGRPELKFCGKAEALLKSKCSDCRVFVSLSHEKEYAVANVIIEKLEG